jgi:hypothetical protein
MLTETATTLNSVILEVFVETVLNQSAIRVCLGDVEILNQIFNLLAQIINGSVVVNFTVELLPDPGPFTVVNL